MVAKSWFRRTLRSAVVGAIVIHLVGHVNSPTTGLFRIELGAMFAPASLPPTVNCVCTSKGALDGQLRLSMAAAGGLRTNTLSR